MPSCSITNPLPQSHTSIWRALYRAPPATERAMNHQFGADTAAGVSDGLKTRWPGLCLKFTFVIECSDFIGRAREIDAIHRVLRPDEASVEQEWAVLAGVGGIGKTQLAIAYARQYQQSYTSVLCLNANSEAALYASLRTVMQALISVDGPLQCNKEHLLVHLHKWLSRPDNARWLLIFDNYNEPDHFDLETFCPNTGHGSVIITTRLPGLVTGQPVRVQPLQDIYHSLAILQARSGRPEALWGECTFVRCVTASHPRSQN